MAFSETIFHSLSFSNTAYLLETTVYIFIGMTIESPTTFSILLYLNHMAVFNFIDERNLPGCAALKLCDGRKRSMSLWVEFITASGDYRNDRL